MEAAQFLILCSVISLIFSVNAEEFLTAESGNQYYFDKKLYNWYNAISVCAEQNMILATPDSESKQAEIFKVTQHYTWSQLWTSGLEVQNLDFVWTTNGNKLNYTNWKVGEPTREGTESHCIGFKNSNIKPVWGSYLCLYARFAVVCEENPQLKQMKHSYENELEMLKKSHENETESIKKSYEIEIKSILENNKRNLEISAKKTTTALDGLKKLYEKDFDLLTEQRKSCETQNELLKTSYENEKEHLLKENKSAMTKLKNESQLMFQENEMSKKIHEKEVNYLQEEKKNLYELLTNRSIIYKNYSIMITGQGNRH